MKKYSSYKIILTALFASLICVATMFIQIPSPMSGYVNLGDGIILMCAFLLGPIYSTAAAGIGSMLADLLAGYAYYAPGTLIIKAGVALIASLIYKRFSQGRSSVVSQIIAGVAAEIFMILGYFIYAAIFLGNGIGAAASIPGNIGQGVMGVAISVVVTSLLLRSHEFTELLSKFRDN